MTHDQKTHTRDLLSRTKGSRY